MPRLKSTSARRATTPARAMFTSGRRMRAASRYCAIADQRPVGTLERLVDHVEPGLHARHEAQRRERVRLPLGGLERLGGDVLLEGLEPQAIDVADARVPLRDLVLHPLDALVEPLQRVVDQVLGVARELQAEVGAAHVHAHLLPRALHVPLAHAHVGLGRAHGVLHLAERVERDDAVDVEVEERLQAAEDP